MEKLDTFMKKIVREQRLGFVATVNEDGTPNLSPKGTCLVLDDYHIIFGEIRSPNTIENISRQPFVEINFVDQFSRKGFRAKCIASIIKRESADFESLISQFSEGMS